MADSGTVNVPNVVGSTTSSAEQELKAAGLAVGTQTNVSSTTVPAGNIISTNPSPGTSIAAGSTVNLEVSSGPPMQVTVPDVVGNTRSAAELILKNKGLTVGPVKTRHSDEFPNGAVSSTIPAAGTFVASATPVGLELSTGPEPNWTQYIPPVLFSILGLTILVIIGIIISAYGQSFLLHLADDKVARGLITFLIAITTVGIAIILAVSTVMASGDDVAGDKRFDRGKQVLSVMIGVLGTIVGFYFGSSQGTQQAQQLVIKSIALPDGFVGKAYPSTKLEASGGVPKLKWSVDPKLPADLTLDSATGTITGTPKAVLPKTEFTFTVTDGSSPPASASSKATLEVKQQ